MKLAKVTDGVVSIVDGATEWPNVSFPKHGPNAEWMSENGVVPFAAAPTFDNSTHKRVSVAPFIQDGKCHRWQVVAKTDDEIAVERELEQKRVDKALKDFLEGEVDFLTQEYSPSEVASWHVQLAEARAFQSDNAAPTPLIDAIIAESGEAKQDMVDNIIAKNAAFTVVIGTAIGKKRQKRKNPSAYDPEPEV